MPRQQPGAPGMTRATRMDPAKLERIFVSPQATLRATIEQIDAGAIEIALVVDARRRLLGTVTDGDVRRALLAGAALDDSIDAIESIVHRDPVAVDAGTDDATLLALMTERSVDQIPLVDGERVIDVAFLRDLVSAADGSGAIADSPVVLMAGGAGTRLRPLTEHVPKPMLPVGDRPLLETVLGQVSDAGFSRVLIAVNYRADVIEAHFGDGSRFGVDIAYLNEGSPLGSAGALRLAASELDRPFIVMNADLLTNVKLPALMHFHCEEGNVVTVGVRRYELELPYGVVEMDGTRVRSLREKPRLTFFVNAGLYAVDPSAVALAAGLPARFDMTDLVEAALVARARVGGFPIREYWLDVGQLADYDRAHSDHATHFSMSA
ncbi:MAG TPA: nucleotidyltransferase family protein [Solirubrobacteraceae bacterium]|nr:nucleotidyltransferase family protein [Solirubrobacteraceae bacterium]